MMDTYTNTVRFSSTNLFVLLGKTKQIETISIIKAYDLDKKLLYQLNNGELLLGIMFGKNEVKYSNRDS